MTKDEMIKIGAKIQALVLRTFPQAEHVRVQRRYDTIFGNGWYIRFRRAPGYAPESYIVADVDEATAKFKTQDLPAVDETVVTGTDGAPVIYPNEGEPVLMPVMVPALTPRQRQIESIRSAAHERATLDFADADESLRDITALAAIILDIYPERSDLHTLAYMLLNLK